MQHLFVTPSGQMKDRWKKAFPEASVVAAVAEVGVVVAESARGIVWLDTHTLDFPDKVAMINKAVLFGWPVVVLEAKPEESDAFHLIKTGCFGYCHVNAATEQLCEVALVVEHGGLWMPPELMQRLLALSVRVAPSKPPEVEIELNALTARELMVADQVAHGATNREIAATLEITERTVKAHLTSIFDKMAVRDRVQLALAMNNIPTYSTVN